MVPLYAAWVSISHLGPGDFVQVECACGHKGAHRDVVPHKAAMRSNRSDKPPFRATPRVSFQKGS